MSTLLDTIPRHTIRQSNLRLLMEGCPASAWAKTERGRDIPSGPGAERGTAIHEVFAAYVEFLHQANLAADPDEMLPIARGILAGLPTLTHAQRTDVFDQAAVISEQYQHNPDTFYGVEIPLETTIDTTAGPVRITGRLDMLEVDTENRMATVTDVKSNHRIAPDSEIKTDFQLACYSLLVLDNMPEIDEVFGTLWLTRYGVTVPQHDDACWTREDADALRESISVRLGAFYAGDLAREFVPGLWCKYCPRRRPGDCTLYRSYYGVTPPPPQTAAQARKLARQIMAVEEIRESRLALLKGYVTEHGPVSVGSGAKAERFGFRAVETAEVDPGALWELLATESDVIGPPTMHLDAFSVNKRSRGYKDIVKAFGKRIDDCVSIKTSTRFTHWAEAEDD